MADGTSYRNKIMATDTNVQSVLNKQRFDKFRLVLTLPPVLRDMDSSDWAVIGDELVNGDSLQFSLYSATIPEVSIPSKLIPVYGQTMKVTSQTRDPYVPVTCKFVVDNRFRNYWVLWKWMEFINDPINSGMSDDLSMSNTAHKTGVLPYDANFLDYQTRISIFPLDEYNKQMCEFEFRNCFITKLSGLNFNYQDPSEIECDWTFDFSQMDLKIDD